MGHCFRFATVAVDQLRVVSVAPPPVNMKYIVHDFKNHGIGTPEYAPSKLTLERLNIYYHFKISTTSTYVLYFTSDQFW